MNREDRRDRRSLHAPSAETFHCYHCSRPLTDSVNADGRARELADVAVYLCESCAEKEQRKTDLEQINCYRILRKLGRGWTTVVYEAWHESTGRLVALRRILPDSKGDEWAADLFRHEAMVMQNFVHPHLVRLIDCVLEGEDPYAVHEFMSGGDLYTHALRGPVPLYELSRMLCQILEGLHHMHQNGFIHRDVKPHNMLLTEGGVCKLSDFGLAKEIGKPEVLKTSGPLGPLWFTAPEQLIDFENVEPSADVYSVGVSAYHLLTQKFPISFPSMQETMKAVLKEKASEPFADVMQDDRYRKQIFSEHWKAVKESILKEDRVSIQQYRKDLPSGLANVIDRSVMRNEKQRFKSATEMRDALITCLPES